MRLLPDCRVDGDTPASDANASGVGNRPRASPISASSRAARNAWVRLVTCRNSVRRVRRQGRIAG